MKLSTEDIKLIAKKMKKSGLTEVALEVDGATLILKNEPVIEKEQVTHEVKRVVSNEIIEDVKKETTEKKSIKEEEKILSPMTGTFYSKSSPENPAFVTEGSEISEGSTLCILEAMKMMNEVKATKNYKILKILFKDGEIVKKGEPLFLVS